MLGERLARRALAGERRHIRGARGRLLGGDLVRGGRALQLSELQGQLVEQPHGALRTLAIKLVPQLGDLQLLMRNHGLIVGGAGLGDRQLCLDPERALKLIAAPPSAQRYRPVGVRKRRP